MSSYNQQQELHSRLEAAQRQMSLVVAWSIIGSFFVFMAGYYAGKKYVLEEAHGALVSESFADVFYGAARSVQELFSPYSAPQKREEQQKALLSNQELLLDGSKEKGTWFAEVARCGIAKEAEELCNSLKGEGFKVGVQLCTSESTDGSLYHWYRVCMYPGSSEKDFIKALEALKHKGVITMAVMQRKYEADNAVL